MGKYLPIITTARCGSLNKAAGELGYTQPSLWYIINTMENDLGIKIFHRTKRGVTLTEAGSRLIDMMVQIEAQEESLRKIAQTFQENRIHLGIPANVSGPWTAELLLILKQARPDLQIRLETPARSLTGAAAVAEHSLDLCVSVLTNPAGLDCFPLFEDPYYAVVPASHPLAGQGRAVLSDILDAFPLIPSSDSMDPDSAVWNIYRGNDHILMADSAPPDTPLSLALVEKGLGFALLSELMLDGFPRKETLRVLPLADGLHRSITLVSRKKSERTPLEDACIDLICQFSSEWAENRFKFLDNAEKP